jgi:2'-5' RNA ligase
LRCFIAIELSESVKSALAELQNNFRKCQADIRWVKPDNIHLTLKFLGDIDDVVGIEKVISEACNKYKPFDIEVAGAGVFPNIRSPRVLWVGIDDNEVLAGLQSAIEDGLAMLGFKKDKRKYQPHLTLGRFRSLRGDGTIVDIIGSYNNYKLGFMNASKVSLIKSELSLLGAVYSKIAEITLTG